MQRQKKKKDREDGMEVGATPLGILTLKLLEAKNVPESRHNIYCSFTCGSQKAFSRLGDRRLSVGADHRTPMVVDVAWNETINLLVEPRANEFVVALHSTNNVEGDKITRHDCIALPSLNGFEQTNFTLKLDVLPNFKLVELSFCVKYLSFITSNEEHQLEEAKKESFVDLIRKDRLGFALSESDIQSYNEYSRTKPKGSNAFGSFSKRKWQNMKAGKELKPLARKGLPLSHRAEIWLCCSGAKEKQRENEGIYWKLLELHKNEVSPYIEQIKKDLPKTFPQHNVYANHEGMLPLKRVLRAYAWKNSSVGYCQSMNFIVAFLLLFMDEESAFWLLCTIVEDLVPEYYSPVMQGIQADQLVFLQLVEKKLPALHNHFKQKKVNLNTITMKWFLSLYINWLPTETTLRVFDAFFCEGCTVLQRIGLAILKMHQNQLLATKTAEEATALLSELPRYLYDADSLIKLAFSSDLGSFKEEKLTQRRFDAQRAIQDKQHLSSFGMLRNLFEGYGEKALRQLADHLLTRMKHASKSPHPPVSGRKLDYSTFLYAMWDVDSKLDDKHVQLLWKVFDPKSKNLVNYFDIIAGLSLIFSGIPLAKLRVCFDCFDMDKDGFLDTREIFSCALVHYKWLVRSLATLTWDVDSQVRAEVENMWKKVRPLLDEKTTGRMNFVQFRFKVVRELKEAEQWLTIGDQLFDMQTLTPLVHSAAELVKDSELGATSSRQSSQTGKNESEELGPMGTGGATGNEDGVNQRGGKPNKAGGTQGGAGLDDEEDGAWKWEIIIKDRSLDEDDQSRIINEKGEVEHVVKVPKILHSFNVNLMANNNHHHHHHHHYGGSMIGMSNNSGTSGEMGYSHSPGSVASELSHHSWSDGEEKEKEKKKKRSIFKPRKKISASSGGLAQQHFSSTGGAGRIPPYRSPRGERTASAADAPYSSLAAAAVAAEALSFSLASSNATASPSPSSSSATYNSHNFTTTNSTSRQSSPIVPHSSDSYSGSEEEPQHSRAKKERRREGGGGAAATSRDNKQVALDDLASLQQRFNPERENTDGGASSESDSEPTTNVAYRAAGGAQQQGKGNNMKTKVQNLKKAVKKTGNYMASGYNKATSKSSTVPTTISPSQELLKKRSGSEPPLVDPKVCGSPTSTHQQSPPTTASPPWPNKMPPQQQHEDGSFVPSSTQAAD